METFKSEDEGNLVEYDLTRKVITDDNFDPEAQVIMIGREFKQPPH